MLKKLKTFTDFTMFEKAYDSVESVEQTSTEQKLFLDITLDDLNQGISTSETNSPISYSLIRNGYKDVLVTNYSIVLENGDVFYPETLTDHWKAYICSPKFKPKVITYVKM
jgi:hypothetical protein